MKLSEDALKKLILEVISESEEEEEESPQDSKGQDSQRQEPVKLKIDIPDEPFDSAEDRPIKEGPSYEYAKHIKKIDKFYNQYWDAVRDFSDLLHDKGLKKQGDMFFRSYMKQVKKWQDFFVRQVRKLL